MNQLAQALTQAGLSNIEVDATLDATNNPPVNNNTLPNVSPLFDRLYDIDQRAGFFALSGFVTSLSYSVLNAHVWNFRRSRNIKAEDSINVFNESFANAYEEFASKQNVENIGYDTLPEFDMKSLTGVYLGMLYRANTDPLAKNFTPRTPGQMIDELTQFKVDPVVAKAWETYNEKLISHSPAAAAIAEAQKVQAARSAARADDEGKLAKEFILTELQHTKPERLSDHVWVTLPVWMQYKFVFGIHKQACAAIAREQSLRESDFDKMDRLIALASELQLELEAAARTAEVKMATNLGRLDNHQLVTTKRVVEGA